MSFASKFFIYWLLYTALMSTVFAFAASQSFKHPTPSYLQEINNDRR